MADIIEVFTELLKSGFLRFVHFQWEDNEDNAIVYIQETLKDGTVITLNRIYDYSLGKIKDYDMELIGDRIKYGDTLNKLIEKEDEFREKLKNGKIEIQLLTERPSLFVDVDERIAYFIIGNIVFVMKVLNKYLQRKDKYRLLWLKFRGNEDVMGSLDSIDVKLIDIDYLDENDDYSSKIMKIVLEEEGDL